MKTKSNSHYANLKYLSKSRWASYYVQFEETLKTQPKSVLEIGKGFGLLQYVLEGMGVKFTSLDSDINVKPTRVGDVRALPFRNNCFDTVVCFEVLEHLPFKYFPLAISELRRVSKKFVIISIPEPYSTTIYFGLKLVPFVPKLEIFRKLSIGNLFFPKLTTLSPHQWELGRKGAFYADTIRIIKSIGLTITKSFYPNGNAYHRFLVLKKI